MTLSAAQYQVAIPSYARRLTLSAKTLPLLQRRGVDSSRVTVFCASIEEATAYRAALMPSLYGQIVVAEPSLRAARAHIAAYYPVGTPVVQIDDDVDEVVEAVDKKTLRPVADLHQLFVDAFRQAQREDCYLWGVAPVPNAFYLAPGQVKTGLRFCIGTLFGWWNRGPDHPTQQLVLDEKEDYERTLRFFDHDGKVLRLDGVSMRTRHYDEPGGMQTYRTVEDSHIAAAYLIDRWPQYVSLNPRRTGPRAEVVLRARKRAPA